MAFSSRVHQPGWLSGAIHAVIIGLAIHAESAEVWPYALIAMSAVSFFSWVANYRRYRAMADLPTSKVASAAQGYVELVGRAEMVAGEEIVSQLSGTPCCWYAYEIQEKDSNDKWRTVDSGHSLRHFHLVDETGRCVISPDGAEVLTNDGKSWEQSNQRYQEWLLLPQSIVYVIGEFTTTSAIVTAAGDESADIGTLLASWKKDQKNLLERFDLDKNGTIDMKEWELARLQARREIRRKAGDPASRPTEGAHLLRKPRDGRLFLIANEMPDALGARYRFWSWAHLVIFIGAGCAGLFML